ncbi:MAG: hypothetical protein SGARI_003055, partial [Bacillariaceae sp.]
MGKTTNLLLQAGQDALLKGRVDLTSVRNLYTDTLQQFHLQGTHTETEVLQLLDDCQCLLEGICLLQELSQASIDKLVSTGERCTARIVAAKLNRDGIPALSFDAWQVGIYTTENVKNSNQNQNAGAVL